MQRFAFGFVRFVADKDVKLVKILKRANGKRNLISLFAPIVVR